MSTVGFGDISAQTYFGRVFMMIFISIGLVCEVYILNVFYDLKMLDHLLDQDFKSQT